LSFYYLNNDNPVNAFKFNSFYNVYEILLDYGLVGNGNEYTLSIPIDFNCNIVESSGCFNIYGGGNSSIILAYNAAEYNL
jgi:hypothetical protein